MAQDGTSVRKIRKPNALKLKGQLLYPCDSKMIG